MKDRRKAQERVREFNRPQRVRPAVARSTAAPQQLSKAVETIRERERRIFWGCDVETGRKQAPSMSAFDGWLVRQKARRGNAELQHAEHLESAERLPKTTTATSLHAALKQADAEKTLSQVRRAVTVANKRARPEVVQEDRRVRRSIQCGLSSTRPAAYAAMIERKREARAETREARRPEIEARAAELARKRAQRESNISVAQWTYDICRQDEQAACAGGTDDLWYLRERRLDAGSALKIARGAKQSPRWEYAESGIGPLTFIQKFGSEAEWMNRARCPTCDKRIHRCKCGINDCSACHKPLRSCRCAWFEYITSDGCSGHPHKWS